MIPWARFGKCRPEAYNDAIREKLRVKLIEVTLRVHEAGTEAGHLVTCESSVCTYFAYIYLSSFASSIQRGNLLLCRASEMSRRAPSGAVLGKRPKDVSLGLSWNNISELIHVKM